MQESAVILVAPGESVESVVAKIRGTEARQVGILIPQGVEALQTPNGFLSLASALATDTPRLIVYSDDLQVLDSARQLGIETLRIEGARVTTAPATTPPPISNDDVALLDALDSLPSARLAPDDYDDALSALDDLSATINSLPAQSTIPLDRDAEAAAAFDDWGDTINAASTPAPRETPAPRPRVRPEDIELTSEDLRRQPGMGGKRTPAPARKPTVERDPDRTSRFEREQPREKRRSNRLVGLLVLLIPLLLIGFGAIWLLNQRTTVEIAPPSTPAETTSFDSIPIMLSEGQPEANSPAIQARQLSYDAEVSVLGRATVRNPAPVAAAKGSVTAYNRSEQPFFIPAGTDVIGINPNGQEVVFSTDQDLTVPAATRRVSIDGESLSFGSATIPITARAPGSASNLPPDSIQQIVGFGGFNLASSAMEGGAEQETLSVGQEDVNAMLGQAVTELYNRGIAGLQEQLGSDWSIERSTIAPAPEILASEQRYTYEVVPAIGSPVEDLANPTFAIVLRTRFTALATPTGRPIQDQMVSAVGNQLQIEGKLPASSTANITSWRWDGQSLTASAEVITQREPSGLPAGLLPQLQRELVGKTQEEARELLEGYKTRGEIGEYRLPERERLPNWSFLLDVAVMGTPAGAQQ